MVIRNTPRVLGMLENVVVLLSKDLQLPERLEHVPINIKTIYSDAANAILKDSLDDLDSALANAYTEIAVIDRLYHRNNDSGRISVDSELVTHIFTKMCVLEFLKWILGYKARGDCLGIQTTYDADYCRDMFNTLKTEYISILHNYGLWKNDKASKPAVVKKKTTKSSKTTTKTTGKSTNKPTRKAASKKKVTK